MEQLYYLFFKYYRDTISSYIETTMDNEEDKNYKVSILDKKLIHTFRVVQNAKEICLLEGIDERIHELSEIAAIFHDIGRIPQMLKYKTFKDNISEDHARLSVDILETLEIEILTVITKIEFDVIKESILYHNKLNIDCIKDPTTLKVSKILRDADKINIIAINLCSNFIGANTQHKSEEEITKECKAHIHNKEVVTNINVNTVYDAMLKYASWVFDLNFKTSKNMFIKNNFLDIIFDTSDIRSEGFKEELLQLKEFVECEIKS